MTIGELLSSWLRHLNCQAIQHTCRNLQQDFMCRPETLMLPSSFSCGCLRRQEMEKAINGYRNIYKSYPERLIELVERGIIAELPHEPLGGYYYFNPVDGRVYSSVVKARMKVYGSNEQ